MECLTRQAVKPTSAAAGSTASITPGAVAPAATSTASAAGATPPQSASVSAVITPTAPVTCAPNVVTIPVPVISQEDIYTYVSIKGSLHDRCSALFGLNDAEELALSKRFENGTTQIVNGVMINAPPMQLINTMSQLGYKVVCSTGEAEIVWTMQREV